jgi:hypothetical protein
VIVYKWRTVLGGVATATFLGTFAAGPAFASTAAPTHDPVIVHKAALPVAALPVAGQLLPGAVSALNAVTALPAISAVTQPLSNLLNGLNLNQATAAAGPQAGTSIVSPVTTGVVPAVGDVTGALLQGVGSVVSNLSNALLPAVGPAVAGLTAPVDGLTQDLGNLSGLPVVGALVGSLPALPDTGALLNDLNGLVNGVGAHAAG